MTIDTLDLTPERLDIYVDSRQSLSVAFLLQQASDSSAIDLSSASLAFDIYASQSASAATDTLTPSGDASGNAVVTGSARPNGAEWYRLVVDGEAVVQGALYSTPSSAALSSNTNTVLVPGSTALAVFVSSGSLPHDHDGDYDAAGSAATAQAAAIAAATALVDDLSGVSDAATARTNLGLGTAATTASTDYDAAGSAATAQAAAIAAATALVDDLSGVSDAATARTNLGLGTMAVEDAAGYAALSGATFTGDVNVTGDASLGGSTLTVDDAGNSVTLGNGTDLYLQNNRRIMIDNATGTPLVALTIDSSNQWKFLNNAITASGVWLAVGPNAPGARLDVQQSADNRNNGIRVSPVGAFSEARMYVDASGNFAVGRGSSDYLTMNSGGDVALTGALDVAGGAFTVDDVTGDVAVGSAEWHESDGWFVLPNTGELRFKNSAGTRQTAFEWQATDRLYIGSTATHITYLTSGDNFYLRTNGANTALRIDNNQKATFYADFQADGNVDFTALPTTDPAVAGRLWNDSGTVKISAG